MLSVLGGLSGPFAVLCSFIGPEDLVAQLEIVLPLKFCAFESAKRLSREAEAHRDDRGRKIATEVRVLEPICGLETQNCRILKSTVTGD